MRRDTLGLRRLEMVPGKAGLLEVTARISEYSASLAVVYRGRIMCDDVRGKWNGYRDLADSIDPLSLFTVEHGSKRNNDSQCKKQALCFERIPDGTI